MMYDVVIVVAVVLLVTALKGLPLQTMQSTHSDLVQVLCQMPSET